MTGGIASGKSTVAQLFAARGVPIIDADQIARDVVAPGSALLQQVFARFGSHLRRSDGSLDRAALRRQVFAAPAERQALEALLHPAIAARAQALSASAQGPYQIHVSPLLVETQARARYDRVLVIDCDAALQLQRLQQRDGIDAQQAQAMLAAQATRAQRLAVADDVIVNEGDPAALAAQVEGLHRQYLSLAAAA